jgi:hypothetical protein
MQLKVRTVGEGGASDVVQVDSPGKSWAGMRRMLFAHCAHFAKEFGDSPTTAR